MRDTRDTRRKRSRSPSRSPSRERTRSRSRGRSASRSPPRKSPRSPPDTREPAEPQVRDEDSVLKAILDDDSFLDHEEEEESLDLEDGELSQKDYSIENNMTSAELESDLAEDIEHQKEEIPVSSNQMLDELMREFGQVE